MLNKMASILVYIDKRQGESAEFISHSCGYTLGRLCLRPPPPPSRNFVFSCYIVSYWVLLSYLKCTKHFMLLALVEPLVCVFLVYSGNKWPIYCQRIIFWSQWSSYFLKKNFQCWESYPGHILGKCSSSELLPQPF